ncbi:hypothetical protein NT017_19530 [Prolixibacter sp. NT017]|nr:hypothetical protein NT017_19530 [Prolixibacter sp. NT017]
MNGGTEENPAYQIGSPIFDKVIIHLNPEYYPGKTFEIECNNNTPDNVFVRTIQLNNAPVKLYAITHEDIVNGGILKLEMANSRPPTELVHN